MGSEFERRLAAIMSADVVGYSRLMGDDDEATVRALQSHQRRMERLIDTFRGRVVDAPGDNLLAFLKFLLLCSNLLVSFRYK